MERLRVQISPFPLTCLRTKVDDSLIKFILKGAFLVSTNHMHLMKPLALHFQAHLQLVRPCFTEEAVVTESLRYQSRVESIGHVDI
jgi:hypothetical protein